MAIVRELDIDRRVQAAHVRARRRGVSFERQRHHRPALRHERKAAEQGDPRSAIADGKSRRHGIDFVGLVSKLGRRQRRHLRGLAFQAREFVDDLCGAAFNADHRVLAGIDRDQVGTIVKLSDDLEVIRIPEVA